VIKRIELSRIENLKKLMKAEGVSALLISSREDIRYITGFTGSAGSVLISRGRPVLITDFRYKIQSRREAAGVADVHIQKKDFFLALSEAARQAGAGTVWFDETSITIEALKRLRKTGIKFKGNRNFVSELRLQKDTGELISIRRAIKRAEDSFRALKKYIRPGVREQDLAFKLECLMRENGSRKPAFDTIVASGPNGAMPHASVTDKRIKQGELVTFDFGAEADGYFSDITRTFCIGRPTMRQREIHALVLKAQSTAIERVSAGLSCKTVDAAARNTINEAGHGDHFGHGTGHGIGLMVHEGPSLSPLSKDTIVPNMVFTVEPGVYVPDWGGVRIEDMVHMTKGGVKVLTSLPRELEGLKSL
jgi:Xaa-Pro aminopeptidase